MATFGTVTTIALGISHNLGLVLTDPKTPMK